VQTVATLASGWSVLMHTILYLETVHALQIPHTSSALINHAVVKPELTPVTGTVCRLRQATMENGIAAGCYDIRQACTTAAYLQRQD